ncbi:MAG TPA: hypothetical protein VJ788_06425 [Gemmatimonadota bacterium]|nr:hypothetical protein [Gemmatimonadota bacterium]
MTRNRTRFWKPALLLGLLLGFSARPSMAQSTDQVWSQLSSQSTRASNEDFARFNYIIGYLDNDSEPVDNWPVYLSAGSTYRIVGVCDNDCTDFDLSLEDADRNVLVSDVLEDDLPIVNFSPSTSATYWIRPTMVACGVNPCGYGIAVFVR